ncbi:MAG: cache domain-containing protein, partial [Methylorubrum rhodinum]|uniref:cache domain-containing protein n=1 Tax=Methylorubrum rhodinum TaxID=29428 RepID=UPI003BB0F213
MTGGVRSRPLVVSFALFALALMLPPATVAILATHWYVESERDRLTHTLALIGEEVRERIDHDLARMEAVARTLAASPSIDAGDLRAFRAQALASIDSEGTTVTLAELDGRQLVNTRAPDDTALPVMPRPETIERLLATRRPVVSGLMTSQLTGRPIVSVVVPVLREDVVVKVVALVTLAEQVEALIRNPHVRAPYWAAVVDGAGNVVARIGQADPAGDALSDGFAGALSAPAEAGAVAVMRITEASRRSDWRFTVGVGRDALEAPLRRSLVVLLTLALV